MSAPISTGRCAECGEPVQLVPFDKSSNNWEHVRWTLDILHAAWPRVTDRLGAASQGTIHDEAYLRSIAADPRSAYNRP